MESKFDWLTLSIKPENPDIDFEQCFRMLGERLFLTDLFSLMVPAPRVAHYEWCIGYENITLCCPSEERFSEQGICIRFSSQGLDFFTRYLDTYFITFKQWLGVFRHLLFEGYRAVPTRIDYAMDDIHYNGDKPFITMKKVIDCYKKGEMCKAARVVDFIDGGVSTKERHKRVNGEPVVGLTMNVGSRSSEKFCRFYDKLAEKLQKKEALPEKCTSWVRCEFEFKDNAAVSVLNAFLDYDEVYFGKYMRGVANRYCSFIVRNNSNISRCSVKRWWSKFLGGCTEKFRLPHKKPARSAYARAQRGLVQYLAIIYTMVKELGVKGFYKFLKQEVDKKLEGNPEYPLYKKELGQNIRDNNTSYDKVTAYKHYFYNSLVCCYCSDPHCADEQFKSLLHSDYSDFHGLGWYVHNMGEWEIKMHKSFLNGCEVLY